MLDEQSCGNVVNRKYVRLAPDL